MRALLDVETAIRELKKPNIAQKSLTFLEVQSGYRPGWSLASSFVLQASAVALITFLALIPPRIARPSHLQFVNVIDFSSPDHVVFLPSVGGGSEGNRPGLRGNPGGSVTPPVRSSAGFSYPGPQATVSDPPDAFNPTQTLLQPALKDLPGLHEFVPLPNMVQMAAAPDPAPARIVVKPSTRVATNEAIAVAPSLQLQPPKLALPLATATLPAMALPDSLGLRKPVEKPIENPIAPPVEVSEASSHGPDPKTLLSLSAIPAPPDVPTNFPHAEARGRFAASPDPLALVSQPAPGAKSGSATSGSAGIGTNNDSGAGDAAGTRDIAAGSEVGTPGGADGGSAGTGLAKVRGTGDGGLGITIGRGSGTGSGIGSGSSASAASGGGAGNGAGSGTFAGITIHGGGYTGGTSANLHPTLAPRNAYGMTIVSTASSGGGLADFGVFSDEKVYTVFMDMRETGAERAPAWTLQYAAASSVTNRNGTIVAPSPLVRPRPQLPAPLLHKYPNAMVVISAMLGTAGHLEDIAVKQTPDARLIPAILTALNNWYFRPAEMDGQPVPLKILLGIPLL